jgi:spoIIIJ-associated protein
MTEEREFEGKDLDEALDIASEQLGVASDELHYEMLEQGRRGLLGVGTKNVRIRVKPPLETELAEDTTEDRAGDAPPRRRRAKRKPRSPGKTKAPPAEPISEDARSVEQTVMRMVDGMGLDLTVDTTCQEGSVHLKLQGPDRKLLTARNAELLAAIQLLLTRMSRRAWPGVSRIHVSCDGRGKPRDEDLISMVRKAAKQVTKTGKTRKLQPMNAYERRLVHLTVRDFPGLTSSSDGGGSLKRVRISKVQNQI